MTTSSHRMTGRLDLRFTRQATSGQTTLRVVEQTPPLRVVRAFQGSDSLALVHLHNVSGGVLGGDHLTQTVRVGPQARVQLTTPGATRIYRHRQGGPEAVQYNHFTVEAGGLLEYLPDPLIPFARSRYRQTTQVNLADGAGLFWWEIIAPGRETRNEVFAYDSLEMAVDINTPQRPIAIERLRLQPALQPPTSLVRLGDYRYWATFYICRVGLPASTWLALESELTNLARQDTSSPETLWAVSALTAEGVVVRALGHTGRAIQDKLISLWRAAKARLYGEAITLPRKLY